MSYDFIGGVYMFLYDVFVELVVQCCGVFQVYLVVGLQFIQVGLVQCFGYYVGGELVVG